MRFYGYEVYGLYCAEQELVCNGAVVSPNFTVNSPSSFSAYGDYEDCYVRTRPCDSVSGRCQSMEKSCEGDINPNTNCATHKEIVPCSTNANYSTCYLSQVSCNGSSLNTSSISSGSQLKGCIVQSVNCKANNVNNAVDITSIRQNCTIKQLSCGVSNTSVFPNSATKKNTYNGSASDCIVKELTCSPDSSLDPLTANCTALQPVCSYQQPCDIEEQQFTCQNTSSCNQPLNVSICICPDDFVGDFCDQRRAMNCSLTLLSPIPNCDNELNNLDNSVDDRLLSADRACLVYGINEVVTMHYSLACQFTQAPAPLPANISFPYWLNTPKFRLSRPANWTMRFKMFNFNKLSDKGMMMLPSLTQAQLTGATIEFRFLLNSVPDRFWAGNRLYLEVGWTRNEVFTDEPRPPGVPVGHTMDRRFIDSADYHGVGTEEPVDHTKRDIGLGVGIPAAVLVLTAYLVHRYRARVSAWWEKREEKKEEAKKLKAQQEQARKHARRRAAKAKKRRE